MSRTVNINVEFEAAEGDKFLAALTDTDPKISVRVAKISRSGETKEALEVRSHGEESLQPPLLNATVVSLNGVDVPVSMTAFGALYGLVPDEDHGKLFGEKAGPPEDAEEKIAEAIASYEGPLTKGGKPTVDGLSDILGFEVTAAQRDAAWEEATQD